REACEHSIAVRVEAGYKRKGASVALRTRPQPTELTEWEERIARAPDSDDTFLVYGDWLQSQGDPRGELVAVHAAALAGKKTSGAEKDLLDEHRDSLLGPLAAWSGEERQLELNWHLGFARSIRLACNLWDADGGPPLETTLHEALRHPV